MLLSGSSVLLGSANAGLMVAELTLKSLVNQLRHSSMSTIKCLLRTVLPFVNV